MLQDRVNGLSMEAIATKYNVSLESVKRRFALIKREELLEKAVERVVERLLDKSLEAYEQLLSQDDNLKVKHAAARDVAFGTGVLSTQNRSLVNPSNSDAGRKAMTLRAWREKRFAKQEAAGEGGSQETRVLELTTSVSQEFGAEDFAAFGEDAVEGYELSPDDYSVEEGL
jgi:AcrR family transcriptional regulator